MAACRLRSMVSGFVAIFFITVIPAVMGSHEMIILHAPDYMKFLTNAGAIKTSEIPKMVSLSMGLSVPTGMRWNGLAETSVFQRPKASVIVTIPGFDKSTGAKLSLHHKVRFPVTHDAELNTEIIENNLQSHFFEQDPLMVDFSADHTVYDLKSRHPRLFNNLPPTLDKMKIKLSDASFFTNTMDIGSLNVTKDADMLLLAELQLIQEVLVSIEKNRKLVDDKIPDLYNFKVSGFQTLVRTYGTKSQQVLDALELLQTFLVKVTEEFKKLYAGNVVVQVVTAPSVDPYSIRKSRSLLATAEAAAPTKNPLNLAPASDPNFPIIFNIILWMGVIMVIIIYAVVYGLINMDPGRDSIIYRMTSQRIKMD